MCRQEWERLSNAIFASEVAASRPKALKCRYKKRQMQDQLSCNHMRMKNAMRMALVERDILKETEEYMMHLLGRTMLSSP